MFFTITDFDTCLCLYESLKFYQMCAFETTPTHLEIFANENSTVICLRLLGKYVHVQINIFLAFANFHAIRFSEISNMNCAIVGRRELHSNVHKTPLATGCYKRWELVVWLNLKWIHLRKIHIFFLKILHFGNKQAKQETQPISFWYAHKTN